jgi:hypothetical protein
MPTINAEQLRTFARDGYLVFPQVVPAHLIDAARRDIADRVRQDPPPASQRGPHFYAVMRERNELPAPLLAPLFQSDAIALAQLLIDGAGFDPFDHVQISRNIPPFDHRPGGPHIDGLTPPGPNGQPWTFTMLAGIFLTDQMRENAGNLWVWPGSHLGTADYLRTHGPDALVPSVPYPPIALGEPRQITGRAGDLVLAHYLLGHNIGGNISDRVREVLYYRLQRAGHRLRWREAVQDAFLEFEPVRAAVG